MKHQFLNRSMAAIVSTKMGKKEKRMNRNSRLILRILANPLFISWMDTVIRSLSFSNTNGKADSAYVSLNAGTCLFL